MEVWTTSMTPGPGGASASPWRWSARARSSSRRTRADPGIGWLFAGRLVAGAASGAAFSSGAAWIKELSGTGSGARRVTVAMTAGFGLGPLLAGDLLVAVAVLATLTLAWGGARYV
jgi:MFS family permease